MKLTTLKIIVLGLICSVSGSAYAASDWGPYKDEESFLRNHFVNFVRMEWLMVLRDAAQAKTIEGRRAYAESREQLDRDADEYIRLQTTLRLNISEKPMGGLNLEEVNQLGRKMGLVISAAESLKARAASHEAVLARWPGFTVDVESWPCRFNGFKDSPDSKYFGTACESAAKVFGVSVIPDFVNNSKSIPLEKALRLMLSEANEIKAFFKGVLAARLVPGEMKEDYRKHLVKVDEGIEDITKALNNSLLSSLLSGEYAAQYESEKQTYENEFARHEGAKQHIASTLNAFVDVLISEIDLIVKRLVKRTPQKPEDPLYVTTRTAEESFKEIQNREAIIKAVFNTKLISSTDIETADARLKESLSRATEWKDDFERKFKDPSSEFVISYNQRLNERFGEFDRFLVAHEVGMAFIEAYPALKSMAEKAHRELDVDEAVRISMLLRGAMLVVYEVPESDRGTHVNALLAEAEQFLALQEAKARAHYGEKMPDIARYTFHPMWYLSPVKD